jgi:hypothetical protein
MNETGITHCVTIVHGTWVHGLKAFTRKDFHDLVPMSWANDESILHKALVYRFKSKVAVRHFGWSGRNSHAERDKAAGDLKSFLDKGLIRFPKAKHYLVCHSHGGNVAMLALQDETLQVQEEIAGVACLATPFLVVNDRPLDLSVFKGFFFILFVIASLLGLGAGILSVGYLFNMEEFEEGRWLFFAFFLGSASYIALYCWFRGRISHYIKKRRASYRKFILPDLGEKLRVIRATGDEATGVLIAGQFVSWVIESLWGIVGVVAKVGSNIWLFPVATAGGAAALYYLISSGWSNAFLDAVFEGGNSMYIITPLTMLFGVAAGLQLMLSLALVASSLLRFGLSYPLMGVLMRVTAEATPLGAVESCLIPNRDEGLVQKGGWFRSHTRVYEDSRALGYLVGWMAGDKPECATIHASQIASRKT